MGPNINHMAGQVPTKRAARRYLMRVIVFLLAVNIGATLFLGQRVVQHDTQHASESDAVGQSDGPEMPEL